MTFKDEYTGSSGAFESLAAYRGSAIGLEKVEMISVQTASNDNGSSGAMDGLEITLTNGRVGRVNFNAGGETCVEPTPMTDLNLDGVIEGEGDLGYAAIGDDFDPRIDHCAPLAGSITPRFSGSPDQVFVLTVPTNDVYRIQVEPQVGGLDLYWSIYEGASCAEAACIGMRNAGEVGDAESYELRLLPSKTYYLVVDTTQPIESSAPYVVTVAPAPRPKTVWINEIHYNNSGGDVDEAIELAGPVGKDLSGWTVVLYNGADGKPYDTYPLSGTLAAAQAPLTLGTLQIPATGMQNGAPDGIALVDGSTVVQFISYQGTFTGKNGPANNMTSVDIGVAETDSTPVGYSLQLAGSGCSYADFSHFWQIPAQSTFGAPNRNQTLSGCQP